MSRGKTYSVKFWRKQAIEETNEFLDTHVCSGTDQALKRTMERMQQLAALIDNYFFVKKVSQGKQRVPRKALKQIHKPAVKPSEFPRASSAERIEYFDKKKSRKFN